MIARSDEPRPGWRQLDVSFTARGRRDLGDVPRDVQLRVIAALERFATTGHGDVRRLTDVRPPLTRLRVGEWRVLCSLSGSSLFVERVTNRKDAY